MNKSEDRLSSQLEIIMAAYNMINRQENLPKDDDADFEQNELKAKTAYANIIDELKSNSSENMEYILALVHFIRLVLINQNEFPEDILDKSEVSNFKLGQYLTPLVHQINDTPKGGDLNLIRRLCTSIWFFTVIGLMAPDAYGSLTKEIWYELKRGADGAYKMFHDHFNISALNSPKLQPYLGGLPEDIKKIPAALR